MKKKICLLLCFWLPLFFSAASYASANMQIADVLAQSTKMASPSSPMAASVSKAESAMPDDCPMNMANQGAKEGKTSHDKCQQCGFCISITFYPVALISDHSLPHPPFSSHIAWTSSPYLSPTDQRPPITL